MTNCVNSIFKILKVSKLDSPCTLCASCIIIDCKPGNYTSPKNNNNILLPWTLPKHGEIIEAKTIWCSEVTPRPTKGLPDGSTKYLRPLLPLEGMQVYHSVNNCSSSPVPVIHTSSPGVMRRKEAKCLVFGKNAITRPRLDPRPSDLLTASNRKLSFPFLLLPSVFFLRTPSENHFCGGGLLLKDASYLLFRTQFRWQLFGYKTNSAIYKPRFSAPHW